MRKLRVLPLLLTLAIVSSTALSGCSGGKQTGSNDNKAPVSESNSATEGHSITVGIPQDLDSLDPHKAVAAGTKEVLFNIYEGLLKPTPNGNLDLALAAKYDIKEEGTLYVFTLKDNLKFHNGKDVTAEDVKYSIDRCAGKDGTDPLVPAFSIIDNVEAKDDKTVEIKLFNPSAEILYSFTTAIIPKDSGEEKDFQPVGTGPFKFVSRTPQDNVIMERFDDYWGDKPDMEKVTFKIIPDANMITTDIKSGAIQMFARITTDQAKQVEDSCNILEGNMNLVQALYLNNAAKPLNDVKVRQALCYAIDRKGILDMVFDGKGTIIGSSMIPYFEKYYMPQLVQKYGYDPDKAKELLADAGYPDGFDLEITVPSNYQQHMDTALVIVDQLSKVGIKATIKPVEWSVWLDEVYTKRDYQSTVVGVDASNLSAAAFLSRFQSDAPNNFINFFDEEYDIKYNEAQEYSDLDKQADVYKECETILADDAANVYIQDIVNLVALSKDYTGFEFYPLYVLDMSKIKYVGNN